MNTKTKIFLKIRDFYKKYKKIIFVIIIIWVVVFVLNYMIGKQSVEDIPSTTYTPHVSVIDDSSTVPEKLQQPIEDLIEKYFNYCNNGEYENAYNMLTEECKSNVFFTLDDFQKYINDVFGNGNKIYNIQNFSNLDDIYIYNIRILDNILANGTTGGYGYYEEKITIIGDDEDNLKLNIGDFVAEENVTIFAEDDYIKIEILSKVINYETEVYKIRFTNKSEYPIVIANGREEFEVGIYIGDQTRNINLLVPNIIIFANSSQTYDLEFTKFADDGRETSLIIFNAIRVLQSYSGDYTQYEEEINNAIKLYSLTISL